MQRPNKMIHGVKVILNSSQL